MVFNSTYGSKIISGSFWDMYTLNENENKRKQPPTSDDLYELRMFLKDFKIKTPLPHFSSVAEMERWRKAQIKMKLGC